MSEWKSLDSASHAGNVVLAWSSHLACHLLIYWDGDEKEWVEAGTGIPILRWHEFPKPPKDPPNE